MPTLAGLTAAFFMGFLCDFLPCVLALVVVVLFGDANVSGMMASANAIPSKVFFMILFSLAGYLPAHNSILRYRARNYDSPGRLLRPPN